MADTTNPVTTFLKKGKFVIQPRYSNSHTTSLGVIYDTAAPRSQRAIGQNMLVVTLTRLKAL